VCESVCGSKIVRGGRERVSERESEGEQSIHTRSVCPVKSRDQFFSPHKQNIVTEAEGLREEEMMLRVETHCNIEVTEGSVFHLKSVSVEI
jgi:hypothetical protein